MGVGASSNPACDVASVVDGHASVLARAGAAALRRPGQLSRLEALLAARRGADEPAVVFAESGSGKSTLLAQFAERAAHSDDYDVVRSVFVGAADGSTSISRVLRELCAALSDDAGTPAEFPEDLVGLSGAFWRLLEAVSAKRVLIVVDALNELDAHGRNLGWLPPRLHGAQVILSTIRGGANGADAVVEDVLAALRRRGFTRFHLTLDGLAPAEQVDLVAARAPGCRREAVEEALRGAADRASPLYLGLAAARLATAPDAPEKSGTIVGAFDGFLAELVAGEQGRLVREMLCAVAVSEGGVFSSQLPGILGVERSALASVASSRGDRLGLFVREVRSPDGGDLLFLRFVHQQARDAVERAILRGARDLEHQRLAAYYVGRFAPSDGAAAPERRQVLKRLAAHVVGAGDEAAAAAVLTSVAFLEASAREGLVYDAVRALEAASLKWPRSPTFADHCECVRRSADLLRDHPACVVQELVNAPDDSAVSRGVSEEDNLSRRLIVWDNKPKQAPACLAVFVSRASMFWSISVSASGETMCAGGSDRNVLVVDLAGGHATGLLAGHDDDVMLIAHNPRVEDELATLARKEAPPGGLSTTAGAAWSELIFFDASTCAQLARKSFEGFASDVRWSPRGDFVAMVLGSRCCVVDRRSLDVVFETDANFAEHARSLSCCAFQENPPPGAARLALAAGLDLFTAAVADGDAPERFTKFERGHVASITSVDWRAGFVVTGGMDEVILLYDATTAAVLRRIEVHVDTVKTVRFNTDCSWVLSGSEDRTARISTTGLLLGAPSKAAPPRKTSKKDSSKRSQVPSKRPASEAAPLRSFLLRGHSSGVQHVVDFSGARGGQIATCGDDGSVRLWDRDRALRQDTTPGPGSAVSASAWCDFGIIVADTRGDVHCYEVQARSQVVWKASLGAAASGHQAITSLSAAGAAVAVGMYKRLHLLAAADGSVLRSVAFADWVNICLLSPKRVVAAGDCEHVVVWAAGDLSEVFRLSHARAARTDSVLALAAFGDDDHVVAGGNDSRVHSYRGRAHAASASLADAGAGDWVCSLAFCERDVVAAATTGDAGSVVLLGTARPSSIDVLRRVRVGCTVAWVGVLDGDSRLLVTATASKLVQVWDRDSLELVAVFAAAARFGSPDGVGGQGALLKRRLAIGDESGQLYLLSIT